MELSREIVVFVYGTLKKGHPNHGFLKSAHPLGSDSVGGFQMYSLGPFPAVCRASENDIVYGETYLVDEQELASLDMLEGYPDFYNRMQIWTEELGELAWIYYQSHCFMHGTLIEGGVW